MEARERTTFFCGLGSQLLEFPDDELSDSLSFADLVDRTHQSALPQPFRDERR